MKDVLPGDMLVASFVIVIWCLVGLSQCGCATPAEARGESGDRYVGELLVDGVLANRSAVAYFDTDEETVLVEGCRAPLARDEHGALFYEGLPVLCGSAMLVWASAGVREGEDTWLVAHVWTDEHRYRFLGTIR